MKLIKTIPSLLTGLALIAITFSCLVSPRATAKDATLVSADAGFSIPGTAISSNISYCAVPDGPGRAEVFYMNATSDTNTSTITFYKVAAKALVTNAVSSATNTLWVGDGTVFSAADVVLVGNKNSSGVNAYTNYQRLVVNATGTASNVVFTSTTSLAVTNGDVIYRMTPAGTIPVGNNCNSTPPAREVIGHSYTGRVGEPTLIEIFGCGTNTVKFNLLNGLYR